MSDLVKQWREYVDSMGSVIGEVEEMADAMAARIEELEDKLATATEALDKIAKQPRTDEHAEGEGNFEEGYDACVGVARDAIRALKSTSQT